MVRLVLLVAAVGLAGCNAPLSPFEGEICAGRERHCGGDGQDILVCNGSAYELAEDCGDFDICRKVPGQDGGIVLACETR